jgi:hypothetical protein
MLDLRRKHDRVCLQPEARRGRKQVLELDAPCLRQPLDLCRILTPLGRADRGCRILHAQSPRVSATLAGSICCEGVHGVTKEHCSTRAFRSCLVCAFATLANANSERKAFLRQRDAIVGNKRVESHRHVQSTHARLHQQASTRSMPTGSGHAEHRLRPNTSCLRNRKA